MKPFTKCDERTHARTHGHRAFYNLPSRAYRPAGDKNNVCFCQSFGGYETRLDHTQNWLIEGYMIEVLMHMAFCSFKVNYDNLVLGNQLPNHCPCILKHQKYKCDNQDEKQVKFYKFDKVLTQIPIISPFIQKTLVMYKSVPTLNYKRQTTSD